jgi:hypothetical protein
MLIVYENNISWIPLCLSPVPVWPQWSVQRSIGRNEVKPDRVFQRTAPLRWPVMKSNLLLKFYFILAVVPGVAQDF